MISQFAVVYSKATGRIRVIHVPDNDSDLDCIVLHQGEAKAVLDISVYGNYLQLQPLINKITGLNPLDEDRHLIIDEESGVVEGVVTADPLCGDVLPKGKKLMAHKHAHVGWRLTTTGLRP